MRRAITLALALSMGFAWIQGRAQTATAVELQSEARREVANDTMSAVLFAEFTDADSAKLAAALNRTVNDALAVARQAKAVKTRSGNSQTYPVYDRGQRLTGWRGRAELRLESRDFEAIAALIGKLQSTLQLAQVQFSVSAEKRKAAEDELIGEAIGAFRARAELARAALGGRTYRIQRIGINTAGAFPPPRPFLARAGAAAEAVPPPQFEGGSSQVSVNVTGTIEVD